MRNLTVERYQYQHRASINKNPIYVKTFKGYMFCDQMRLHLDDNVDKQGDFFR